MENNSTSLTRHPPGKFGAAHPENDNFQWFVYKVKPMSQYSDSWEWTIVERCSGKSIRKIVETLYLGELRKGAELVDIGIWKSFFDRAVVATVYELAHRGYIRLVPSRESRRDDAPAKAYTGRRAGGPGPEDTTGEPKIGATMVGAGASVLGGRYRLSASFARACPHLLRRVVRAWMGFATKNWRHAAE